MKLKKRLFGWLFAAEFLLHEQDRELYEKALAKQREEERKRTLTESCLAAASAEVQAAHALVAKWKPKPPRFDRYRAMDEDQIAEVLAGAGELPAVKAIMQMIDEKFQQANDAASDPELDDRTTKFNLGGADWMVKLKGELQAALELERKPEPRR